MSQMTIESKRWGTLDFVESKRSLFTDCHHCLLLDEPECIIAQCGPGSREDGKHGYFTIHQMPRKENHDPYPEE